MKLFRVVFLGMPMVVGLGWVSGPLWAHGLIGVERCQSCHAFEFEMWQKGPHARAHQVLSAEQLADPKCSTCHTMAPERLEPAFIGIQCERCHGGGEYYYHDYVMKDQELARAVGLLDVTAATCQQCHTAGTPSIEPFSYDEMWAEIDHSQAARKKWQAARAESKAP